jgi:hypothetical protein
MTPPPFLIWNPWGLFGIVAAAMCWTMALFVFRTRPDRTQNRRLAAMLAVEGVVTLFSPSAAALAGSDATARVFFTIHVSALFVIVPILLRFIATIETPLAAPLATRAGAVAPWLYAFGGAVLFVISPGLFVRGFWRPWWGGRMFDVAPLGSVAYAVSGLAALYSLAVAVSAFRRAAPGAVARDRARRYAIAFGVRDTVVLFATSVLPGIYGATHGGDIHPIDFAYVWAIQLTETVFVLLMAYGVLRSQLFDIDLRIATGVRRSTVAAVVLFAFFAAAELTERLVSETFGYVIGAFAAAALIFAHKPLERFAAGRCWPPATHCRLGRRRLRRVRGQDYGVPRRSRPRETGVRLPRRLRGTLRGAVWRHAAERQPRGRRQGRRPADP